MDTMLNILFAAAMQFSHFPTMEIPPTVGLHHHEMMLQVCNDLKDATDIFDSCVNQHGLVAAYIIEEHRVVYDADYIDLDNDSDNSYLVHEFVHALQAQSLGDSYFETCNGALSAEKQAYAIQQIYLKSRSQMLQVGDRIRFIECKDFN
jgi:hypothetical protein